MRRERSWVGIDVSADTLSLCAISDAGEILKEAVITTKAVDLSAALHTLKTKYNLVVGIESGDIAIPLVRELRQSGYDVRVLETRTLSKFLRIRQNKTDRNDARGIADAARLGGATVAQVLLKTAECQQLRSEIVLRSRLMRQRVAIENGIRAVLRLNGARIGRTASATLLQESIRNELSRLRAAGNDINEILAPTVSTAAMLRRTLAKITSRIERSARTNDVCRRLMTVPGIGPLCALSFYTTIEDPFRFERSDDVAPYLGLVPKVFESGGCSRHGKITKAGNKITRTYLHSAATVLMQPRTHGSPLRTWALALAERRGRPKAKVALARKLAIVMLAIWKSGDVWRPEGRDP